MVDEDALADAYEDALAREKAGDPGAAEAWQRVLALSPADPGGAALRLAALGAAPAPIIAPAAYVATLFDQHAEVFDGILVDQLEYGVPMLIRERLQAMESGPFPTMLDLGCGTGLVGEAVEDMCAAMTGVDLAPGMIEIADEKELYTQLFVGDATRFLAENTARHALITAADVLPYMGTIDGFVAAVAARLEPGGLFAFSTESIGADKAGAAGWAVTAHHRYAHTAGTVDAALAAAGLEVADRLPIMVRRELGTPIDGELIIARAA